MDESRLIEALKQRDPAAMSEVFEIHANRVWRLALSLLHDEQQADGVVQNTFLALIEHIDGFEGRASIGTWLYRVAYNECAGRIRRARPDVSMDEFDEGEFMPASFIDWDAMPDAALTNQEAAEQMQQAIDALPPALRTVFLLRDVEGLDTRSTAQTLGISESAVKVRLHRARLALRESLAAYFEEYQS